MCGRDSALRVIDLIRLKRANLLKKLRLGLKKLYRPQRPPASISDKQLLKLAQPAARSCQAIIERLKQRDEPLFLPDHRRQHIYVELIRQHYPTSIPATIARADQICKHVFDLLGYQKLQFPEKINWNSDPRSDVSWKGYYLNIDCLNLDDASDMRIPWELSRFQHFIVLGRAYWYTKAEKYAREFVNQLQSWWAANPSEWGINWICTMEVALRSISWIQAYYFFLDSPSFTQDIQIRFIKSLIQHGRHILGNLEGNPYGKYGNHYITNGLGLFCLGLFLADFKMGHKWTTKGLDILWHETEKQIYSDGVDYEQSIDYQRQVLEFLLLVIMLCRNNNISVPAHIKQRVEKMLEFSLSYTRSDGSVPMIGDADNGWLWSQAGNGHSACLAAGAVLFDKPGLKPTSGLPEASCWLLGTDSLKAYDSLSVKGETPIESKAFSQGGFYIMRHEDLQMVLHCSKYGLHGHNDLLSLDLFAHGQHFIADPGTYNYTGSYEWRNYFRSTYSHNTIRIDEQEFHPLSKDTIWQVAAENKYKVINWTSTPEYDFFDAEHYCYHRLVEKITHRRQVLFVKQAGYFIINDILNGPGRHKVELIFNLAPIQVALSPTGTLKCQNANGAYMLIIPDSQHQLEAKLTDAWISYVYGVKTPTKKLVYSKDTTFPNSLFTIIYPGKRAPAMEPETIKETACKAWKRYKPNPSSK